MQLLLNNPWFVLPCVIILAGMAGGLWSSIQREKENKRIEERLRAKGLNK